MRTLFGATLAALVALAGLAAPAAHAGRMPDMAEIPEMPTSVYGGAWPTSHVQGVAVDEKNGHMYFSFTQMLVKTDLHGNVLGTVEGLTGHLGDLTLNVKDGRVYGSLEYKDAEAFYIAIFDVDEIDRVGMDAESDGVMTTVYLPEVVEDFTADMNGDGVFDGDVADTPDHRYGCSGIDGVAFGPSFGSTHGKQKLMVAYGVYSNTDRVDNDHQVVLEYDVSRWRRYERPLSQQDPHTSGPAAVDGKYFLRTGNTTYGVQNLEYDPHTERWMMAVYEGKKEQFPNYSFFMVDAATDPVTGIVAGQPEPETGELLSLAPDGRYDPATGTFGWDFHGQYGLVSLGNGYYYAVRGEDVVEDGVEKENAYAELYRWTGATPTPFQRVTGS
ncbi:hypothetical protein CLV30_11910 [Haloactinopolyspora alba]|uniref:Uncharacterized protein n=1 Tax=Haloactinopolyspora alba TaxID=648780 RepID=A0A2P8DN55_9ACTN|nr:hypothetical protein [Haloactinopolyspora alba]PSK98629.1 hypothetical protein CLV30_11910 [Haloactinopolyspora alba]